MKKSSSGAIIFVAICIFMAFSNSLAYPQINAKKKVLIINSYHIGYKWTDDINKGIESILKEENVSFYIEYLDTKKIYNEHYFDLMYQIYKQKFANVKFDVIISSDDDAFNFLRKYRDELFPKTPVVFCGVNYFKDSDLEGYKFFTGVNEEIDIKAGLEIALKLHPNTKQFVVVNDLTTTGIKVHEKLVEVIENYQNSVNFVFLEDIEMPELQEKIQRLGSDSLVFYTLFFRDKAGKFFEYDESITLIASKCNVPIYGTWDFSLGYGIVGGMLASGFYQGETAAKLALRVLRGENISNIPVVKESPNRFMFDYKQLERFGIKLSDLPKEKIVINQPVSFYTINKTIIWAGIGIFIILLIYVITLTINTFRRRRAERSLRESEERFRQMAENTKEVFWLSSLDGSQLLYINPAYEEVWGRSAQSQYEQPKSWLESVHPEDYDRMLKVYERYTQGGFGQAEFRIVRPNGEIRWIASRTFPVRNEQGVVYRVAGINVDITDLKLTVLKTLQDTMVTLAHYIRNANTVIGGFAARLLKHTSDDDTKQHLQLVHQASKEIDAVINSLQHLTEVTTARYTKDSRATMIDLKKELEARLGPPRKQGHIDEPSKKL